MGPKKRSQNDVSINLSGIHINGAVTAIGQDAKVSAKRIKIESNVPPPKVSTNSKASSIIDAVVPIAGGKVKVEESIKIKRQVSKVVDEEKSSDQKVEVNQETSEIKAEDRLTVTVKEISNTASRSILQRKAPQFAAMLEQGSNTVDNVDVPVFEALLNYAQTGEIDDEFMKQNSVDVLVAAKQYKYADMQAKALEYIKSSK